jgi:hypothetical protein
MRLTTACSGRRCATPLMLSVRRRDQLPPSACRAVWCYAPYQCAGQLTTEGPFGIRDGGTSVDDVAGMMRGGSEARSYDDKTPACGTRT